MEEIVSHIEESDKTYCILESTPIPSHVVDKKKPRILSDVSVQSNLKLQTMKNISAAKIFLKTTSSIKENWTYINMATSIIFLKLETTSLTSLRAEICLEMLEDLSFTVNIIQNYNFL